MYRIIVNYEVNRELGSFADSEEVKVEGFYEGRAIFLQKIAEYSRLIAQLPGKNACDVTLADEHLAVIDAFKGEMTVNR